MESIPAEDGAWRRADQPGICASVRGHGPVVLGARGVQLFRAGHGQYGGARTLRRARAQGTLADA